MELLQRIKEALQLGNTGDQETGQQKDQTTDIEVNDLTSEIIDTGCSTYLVSAAARICVGRKPVEEYDKRIQHINRVIGRGHESTLEHTNIIMMLHFNDKLLSSFTKLASSMFYLHWYIHQDSVTKEYHVLIGGSIRGYKNIFRDTKENSSNPIYEEIKMNLASSAESVFFEDFFEDGIMNKNDFAFVDAETPEKNICGSYVDFMQGHKKFSEVFNQVHQYGFDEKEVMNVCTITVIFHDISRPISMQIIRHRNGISQESQRYVDYSTKSFIDPMQYTKDENKDKTYSVALFGINKSMKSKDLGNELMQVYKQLTQQGMLKQDARGFLPSNVCTKLMMTFTYSTFFHFLNMRQDKAAQPEIQAVANEACDEFAIYDYDVAHSITCDKMKEFADKPEYYFLRKHEEEKISTLDEIISEE